MATALSFAEHKLLVANRGEIAVRILRTAKQLGLQTVAIYTQADATAPHAILADESVALLPLITTSDISPAEPDLASDSKGYLDSGAIIKICKEKGVTLLHPGYGFLSENAEFARLLAANDIILLGPDAQTIEDMGLKHRARDLAVQSSVPIVPGSRGLVETIEDAEKVAEEIGYPVMLKATAGGGGMGLVVCHDVEELRARVNATQQRARSLFNNAGVFIEKFIDSSRHIEVQVFGNGCDHVIHMGERECSVQRRHQKIIEEAPSPFLSNRQDLREKICSSAVRLAKHINYKSAGTIEFLVDNTTGDFYFLEMNTRLQVEHAVTEMLHPGLDIVELMIRQGVYEYLSTSTTAARSGLPSNLISQANFSNPKPDTHTIEARVYCENPINNFSPSPGILQRVEFPTNSINVRVDTWVSTGLTVTPFYDPLVAKIIVCGSTRAEAIERMLLLLTIGPIGESDQSPQDHVIIQGPPNNISFLCNVFKEDIFRKGLATTEWVDRGGVKYTPSAFTVLSPGINTTVQSLPPRDTGLGIPPSGPMDTLAFQAGNAIVGNPFECEGLELVVPPKSNGRSNSLSFSALFHVPAAIAITGANATARIDGKDVSTWARVIIPAGSKLIIGNSESDEGTSVGGLRAYLTILGGFPAIPEYLGSKSTSMGSGGYQGRALQSGDVLEVIPASASLIGSLPLLNSMIPRYPSDWKLYSLPGPHDDTEFITASGIEAFYARKWKVSSASNRMGMRLLPEGAEDLPAIDWARQNGGDGGSHPSNILDNGYARGSVNLNGDTPVILTNEGPSMGGYLCISTIASADQWKLGQIRPGDTLQFTRVSYSDAMKLQEHVMAWLESVLALTSGFNSSPLSLTDFIPAAQPIHDPKLHCIPASPLKPKVVFRQAGDSAILVEYGEMTLEFAVRARIHGLERALRERQATGIKELAPCIRSTMITYDACQITQDEVLAMLIDIEKKLPDRLDEMEFPGRRLTFPIALDDKWNKDALLRYMRSARDEAVYLPSNIEYLAKNNGIESAREALRILVSSSWLVFGVGFYLACPFLVPIDPRCRLVGQKMNPSRTFTPRGAVGIAGLVAAIYPVESPGGYQLFGRTLPAWQAWGKGVNFSPAKPWLLEPFDQVVFEPVSEARYSQVEKEFDSGRYTFKIEPVTFSMKEYLEFISSIKDEILSFKTRQAHSVSIEEARETILLSKWQEIKKKDSESEVSDVTQETSNFASASLSGTVWQLKVAVGDIIISSDQIVIVLEAMKTEINVMAGEENVGLRVCGFAKGIKEGKVVQAGDKLVFFAEN